MSKFIQFLCLSTLILGSTMHAMDSQDQLRQQLIDAARWNYKKVLELLQQKVYVDAQDSTGNTPLIYAAMNGHKAICQLLINHNAQIDALNINGNTPLMQAARFGQNEVCQLLIKYKASINTKDQSGYTSLMLAACYDRKNTCLLLIDAMLKPIRESKTKAIAFLGIKKFRASTCLGIINRDATQIIARQMMHESVRNLFEQINAIENNELKQEILAYAHQQLNRASKIEQGDSHE